jgi:hypothetical protein
MDYRNMLISIFSQQGFNTFQTNEPNIMIRPENLFMARIGINISDAILERIKQVRFDFYRRRFLLLFSCGSSDDAEMCLPSFERKNRISILHFLV